MTRPAGSKNKSKALDKGTQYTEVEVIPFTGVARSVECVKQQGHNNFYIVNLVIQEGLVVEKKVSDPYASFEAIARLEIQCHQATLSLNQGYENGKAWKN